MLQRKEIALDVNVDESRFIVVGLGDGMGAPA
jgi:hypothetical protein